MFRLHARPLPTSPICKLSLLLSLPVCGRSSLLTGEGGGRAWSRIIPPRESLGFYKSSILSACGHANQERCAHCQKFMLSQENHTVKTVKCYGDKFSKITQIYCRNTLLQYFVFVQRFPATKILRFYICGNSSV